MALKNIQELTLYEDFLGRPVKTPVLQVGSGEPHVIMTALQHGWELIGLDAALQVLSKEDLDVRGTITLVSVLNPSGFMSRSRFVGDNMGVYSAQTVNLNRVHPGVESGNMAERSAYAIDGYIKSLKPDYLIDLHSYASQSLPHAIVDPCSGHLKDTIYEWMRKSGNLWYREFENVTLEKQALNRALSAIWVDRSIPAITLELGPLDAFSVDQSQYAQQVLMNVLIAAEAINGEIVPDKLLRNLNDTIWQRQELIYSGARSGYLRPKVRVGDLVQRGTIVAEIVQPDGAVVDTVVAPSEGLHFIWHNEYRIMPGSVVGVYLTGG